MNDPRLAMAGRQVVTRSLSPNTGGNRESVYPFWKPQESPYTPPRQQTQLPSPVPTRTPILRTREIVTEMQSQLSMLESEFQSRQKARSAQRLLAQMNSFISAYDSKQSQRKAEKSPQRENRDWEKALGYMERQQEQMFELIKEMRGAGLPQGNPSMPTTSYQSPSKDHPLPLVSPPSPIEDRYFRLKNTPSDFSHLYGDLSPSEILSKQPNAVSNFSQKLASIQPNPILKQIRRLIRYKAKTRGKARLRVWGWVALFPIYAFSSMMSRRKRERAEKLKLMTESIEVYMDAARTWIMRAIRMPLLSVTNDPELDLDVVNKILAPKEATPEEIAANPNVRVVKIQVRIKGILDDLMGHTNREEIPMPLRGFVGQLVSNEAHLPQSYILGFEMSRLDRDGFGGLRNQTQEKKELLIVFFFITRVLVRDILLKIEGFRRTLVMSSRVHLNLKILASVLQHIVLSTFHRTERTANQAKIDLNEIKNRKKGEPLSQSNRDGVSETIFSCQELNYFLLASGSLWLDNMKNSLLAWAERMENVCRLPEKRILRDNRRVT